ncbi:MAG: hypothetical protein AABZ23_02050 [Deltaproteobacteria bacterium]
MGEFKYEIAGKVYVQKPLVLGQIKQMLNLLKGVALPADPDALNIAAALGDRLSNALAVILVEEGTRLRDKNMDKVSEELDESMSLELAAKVIEDFFLINPILSLLKKAEQIASGMMQKT